MFEIIIEFVLSLLDYQYTNSKKREQQMARRLVRKQQRKQDKMKKKYYRNKKTIMEEGVLFEEALDLEKLKKWAGYAGLGLVAGWLSSIIFIGYLRIEGSLIGILSGFLGGAITKKWWGALVGGFILSTVLIFLWIILGGWIWL